MDRWSSEFLWYMLRTARRVSIEVRCDLRMLAITVLSRRQGISHRKSMAVSAMWAEETAGVGAHCVNCACRRARAGRICSLYSHCIKLRGTEFVNASCDYAGPCN